MFHVYPNEKLWTKKTKSINFAENKTFMFANRLHQIAQAYLHWIQVFRLSMHLSRFSFTDTEENNDSVQIARANRSNKYELEMF